MKAHIEYDDFGEYIEVLEEETCRSFDAENRTAAGEMKLLLQKLFLITAALTVMLGSSSYAAESRGGLYAQPMELSLQIADTQGTQMS